MASSVIVTSRNSSRNSLKSTPNCCDGASPWAMLRLRQRCNTVPNAVLTDTLDLGRTNIVQVRISPGPQPSVGYRRDRTDDNHTRLDLWHTALRPPETVRGKI